MVAFREVWAEPKARAFTIFVFLSMFAYGMQDLILEPFAGAVFGMTPGESTGLTGVQYKGALLGLIVAGVAAGGKDRPRFGSVRVWTVGGCVASGVALMVLMVSGYMALPLRPVVFAVGFSNGAFAAAAIGWMMMLAGDGRASREGVRMGLWGGAQAIGVALGSFLGTVGVDVVRYIFDSQHLSYAAVFAPRGHCSSCPLLLPSVCSWRRAPPKAAFFPLINTRLRWAQRGSAHDRIHL